MAGGMPTAGVASLVRNEVGTERDQALTRSALLPDRATSVISS